MDSVRRTLEIEIVNMFPRKASHIYYKMTSTLSVMSLESQRLRYGKYSLWFSENKIYVSDGEKTNYLDMSDISIIEWTPDTEST